MPFNHRSNNKILPPNSRAVDVAQQAIRDIAPIQQRKYQNAFEVNGYETLVYNRLTQGLVCSCQAHRRVAHTILDEDGKMPVGTMNKLLTGGLEFVVGAYGSRSPNSETLRKEDETKTPLAREDQIYGDLTDENRSLGGEMIESYDLSDPFNDTVGRGEGVNGPAQPQDLDDVVEGFDTEVELGDSKCAVCFGNGFVGGYSLLGGWRKVIAPHSPEVYHVQGTIEINQTPHAFYSDRVTLRLKFPRGFVDLDSFQVWNNDIKLKADNLTIDGVVYNPRTIGQYFNGAQHEVIVYFDEPTYWTHMELQIGLTNKTARIEFPRLAQSSNMAVTDLTEDVQINAGPMIPRLQFRDVFVESAFGKVFVIGTCNPWNDALRNHYGWDCSARVIQHAELLYLLPRRKQRRQRTVNQVRDNVGGGRRT